MARTTKVAVSLPTEIFELAEGKRKKSGLSRSAYYAKALETYSAVEIERALEQACIAGYLHHPITKEEKADFDAFARLSAEAIALEDPEGWKE